jgi:hypothetical protein
MTRASPLPRHVAKTRLRLVANIDQAMVTRDLEDWKPILKHYDLIWGPVPAQQKSRPIRSRS